MPNSSYTCEEGTGRIAIYSHFKLLEGEEVTIDYGHKKGQLKRIYGFECQCGGCTEWGSDRSVGSSSQTGSLTGSQNGEGEKEMSSLDIMVKDRRVAMEERDIQ